jgi:hypothetical protein
VPRTKEAGKQARPVIVILIYTTEGKAPKTRIVIKVIIKTRKSKHRVRVLVNSGIEANYIKKRLALDMSILLILRVTPLISLKERRIYLYKDYVLGIITENTLGN